MQILRFHSAQYKLQLLFTMQSSICSPLYSHLNCSASVTLLSLLLVRPTPSLGFSVSHLPLLSTQILTQIFPELIFFLTLSKYKCPTFLRSSLSELLLILLALKYQTTNTWIFLSCSLSFPPFLSPIANCVCLSLNFLKSFL